jgi:hypothetical protein
MRSNSPRQKPFPFKGLFHFIFKRELPMESETSLFIFVNLLDFFLTYWGLWHGYFRESNPIARWFLDGWGLIKGLLMYKLVLVAVVCGIAQIVALERPQTARRLLLGTSLMVGIVVIYSLRLILLHGGVLHAEESGFEFLDTIQ